MKSMDYVWVSARFKFLNGKKVFTVEYVYGISKWFVFNNEENTNAIYSKEDKKIMFKDINNRSASDILYDFLNLNPSPTHSLTTEQLVAAKDAEIERLKGLIEEAIIFSWRDGGKTRLNDLINDFKQQHNL